MSIINAEDLEASPLADLHALASTLGIDGFRRLRKPELVESILSRQGGETPAAAPADGQAASGESPPSRSGRPPRRRRGRARDSDSGDGVGSSAAEPSAPQAEAPPRNVEGIVELLPNGSGFVRPDGAKNSDGDVYISAAQARRCELVAGDRVSGPVRPPRRSERHPSMIRIDTINGVAADEAVNGTRIDDIEVDWPTVLLPLGSGDAVLTAISQAAPFGRGSRVVISGPARSGKTVVLGRLAAALAPIEGLELEFVAVGVRPEELSEYKGLEYYTAPGHAFGASHEAQDAAVEQAVERGRRVAVRGGDAVLLIDTLSGLSAGTSKRALAAARNLRGAGSLTIIATARESLGGETTVIALEGAGAAVGIDKSQSGTLRADLLAAEKPKRAAAAKPRAPRKRAPAKAAAKGDSAE
jgi:transcription termination factor Rho